MSETTPYTGGCLCGALRYEATGEPRYAGLCYCADCRKATGSGFAPFLGFPSAQVRVAGPPPLVSRNRAANGNEAVRNSCPVCGGLVFGGILGTEGVLNIYAGSLDDPSQFRPTVAIFTESKPDWVLIPPSITRTFPRMPG